MKKQQFFALFTCLLKTILVVFVGLHLSTAAKAADTTITECNPNNNPGHVQHFWPCNGKNYRLTTDNSASNYQMFRVQVVPRQRLLSNQYEFCFNIAAEGTFLYNCGPDDISTGDINSGTRYIITKNDATPTKACCTYTSNTDKIIWIGRPSSYITGTSSGNETYFSLPQYNQSAMIPAINFERDTYDDVTFQIRSMTGTNLIGNLGKVFPKNSSPSSGYDGTPRFYKTFASQKLLTSIPATLFYGPSTLPNGTASDGTIGSTNSMFFGTFYNCTGLTDIPSTLFYKVTGAAPGMFNSTFSGCTGLTSVPGTLFSTVTGSANGLFNNTFSGCTGLTGIPSTLFSTVTGSAPYMFSSTFSGCEGLTSVPGTLFSGVNGSADYMFDGTFKDCKEITSIPSTLFSTVTGSAPSMFSSTFSGCEGLTSVPGTLFSGVTGSANSLFNSTFSGCASLTEIPENLFSGVNGSADTMFFGTFKDCTSLKRLPYSLFPNITSAPTVFEEKVFLGMFEDMFNGCTSLGTDEEVTYVPYGLFKNMDRTDYQTGAMENIFAGTSLETSECPSGTDIYQGYDGNFRSDWNTTDASTSKAISCAYWIKYFCDGTQKIEDVTDYGDTYTWRDSTRECLKTGYRFSPFVCKTPNNVDVSGSGSWVVTSGANCTSTSTPIEYEITMKRSAGATDYALDSNNQQIKVYTTYGVNAYKDNPRQVELDTLGNNKLDVPTNPLQLTLTYDLAYSGAPDAVSVLLNRSFSGYYSEPETGTNAVQYASSAGTITSDGLDAAKAVANNTTSWFAHWGNAQVYGLPTNPTREGHTFVGWLNDNTDTPIQNGDYISQNTNVSAQWTADEYSITYGAVDGNDISYAVAVDPITGHPNATSYTYEDNVKLYNPLRVGYDFGGWCKYTSAPAANTVCTTPTINAQADNATATIAAITAGTETGARWFYANWSAVDYTVTYDCGAGSGTHQDVTQTFGTTFTVKTDSANCSKTGYHFVSWACKYLDGNAGAPSTDLTTNTTYSIATNALCTAQWDANNIYLHWNNGASTVVVTDNGSSSCKYDAPAETQYGITVQQVTRPGYTFNGWDLVIPSP